MVAKLSSKLFSLRIYSIIVNDPFLVVWNSRRSCITLALEEAKKIHSKATRLHERIDRQLFGPSF